MASYQQPAALVETTLEVKKSRFIAWLCPAASREAAMEHLARAQDHYPDARHHCWAYLLGAPHQPLTMASSDDGEPSGTAGKPILNVMQHKPVGDAMVIVSRYFGGIKLGAGGLVRAYSQAAQQAYDAGCFILHEATTECTITCGFHNEQSLRHWLEMYDGQVVEAHYGAEVQLSVAVPESHEKALRNWCAQRPDMQIQD